MNSPLFLLCIIASLMSLFVAGSNGGVTNLCEKGKFFDRSKQMYVSCLECKSEVQDCFSCCQTELQDKASNNNILSTPTPRHQAKVKPGSQNAKPQPVEGNKFLPNIFVVSIISVFIIGSLLVLVLVVVRSSLGRREEAREGTNTSSHQQSGVVIEVMMAQIPELIPEHKEDTNEGDTASEGIVRT